MINVAVGGAPPATDDQRIFVDGHGRVGGKTQLGWNGDRRDGRRRPRSVDRAGLGHVIIAAVHKIKEHKCYFILNREEFMRLTSLRASWPCEGSGYRVLILAPSYPCDRLDR